MILQIVLLIVGFIILIKGADMFVDGASSMAGNFKIPKILIGLTIVAFGTSAPEFAVSVKALLSHNQDIVIGNVIGSNIMNAFLIIGISSLVHALNIRNSTVKKELPITLLITAVFAILLSDGLFKSGVNNSFTRNDGLILLLFFAIYVYYLISVARTRSADDDVKYMPLIKAIIYTILGILGIIFGSNFVVDNAVGIATTLGISGKLIGLTIIAFGTSLPELVTSITAAKKGEYDLVIGNVIGSNIFNIGLVASLPIALFGGIDYISINYIDVIAMLLSAGLLFIFAASDRKITKKEGIILLSIFALYYVYAIFMG